LAGALDATRGAGGAELDRADGDCMPAELGGGSGVLCTLGCRFAKELLAGWFADDCDR
jgi:hypothetical protein